MSITEIKAIVAQLGTTELKQFAEWFDEFRAQLWDTQLALDSETGRLDELIKQAQGEFAAGRGSEL